MKKLLCLMGGAMLFCVVEAQKIEIKPYNIGDRVNEFPLTKLLNYKEDSASISSFGRKLIILDFWGTHCGSCVKDLPEENLLQTIFKDKVQFIMITSDDSTEVSTFLQHYNKSNKKLTIPIVTSDVMIQQMFWHLFLPHYVWLSPNGTILAQTSTSMLKKEVIEIVIKDIQQREKHLKDGKFADKYFHFPIQNGAQRNYLQQYKN